MADVPVTAVIVMLFLAIGGLLAHGFRVFGHHREGGMEVQGARRVRMGREVLWTGIATLLLLAIFVFAR